MNTKKSQIKMFETIAIIVVFFILLMLGFIFYTKVQKTTYEGEAEELTSLNAVVIAERASFLPEIQCSFANDQKNGCLDVLKLEAARQIIYENPLNYFFMFGNSKIAAREIYPSEEEEIIIYDFPKDSFNGVISTQFPVELYNPMTEMSAFGILQVDYYK